MMAFWIELPSGLPSIGLAAGQGPCLRPSAPSSSSSSSFRPRRRSSSSSFRPHLPVLARFLAMGSRICRPVDKSPSQPLSESVYPWRCSKPSPALLSAAPPTLSSRLRTLPRFGTSWSSVPLARLMSTGLLIQKSMLYSTMPRALRGASLMSVITSLRGSLGSTSPKATPLSVSYCPTVPNKAPPKATARELIWMLVMRASAGSPMPARAIGSKLTNAARTNGLMVLSSSRTMLLVCAAPMQPRPRTAASFMRNASEPAGKEEKMTTRREFVSQAAAPTGSAFMGCDGLPAAWAQAPRRREVVVSGRRVKTVDVHAHCGVPEAMALMGLKLAPASLVVASERIHRMDEQGIDVEALSINPYWYAAERDLVAKLIGIQNEKLAEICAAEPERFVAFASVALQFPDLAVKQLEDGVRKLGLRGAGVGGSVNVAELSDPKFHPFWARAEELGVLIFIHPQGTAELKSRLRGNGGLENTIGNPLETTLALSHLIFEGTLDRFPGLKICAAHGGGYLRSYALRSDHICLTFPERCAAVPLKKQPTEYLKQLYFDSIVFTPEALRHLAAQVGSSQIVLGTDYPFPWTQTAVEHILATPGLSDAERAAMLGGTAAKLLGIKED